MVFNGGRAIVSGRRKLGIGFALLAALFAFGLLVFLMFADPAWAQGSGSGDLADEQVDENQGQDADADNRIEELIIDEDCDVGRDAVIVFEDQDGDRFTVENGNNVRIREINDQVVVEDLAEEQERTEDGETNPGTSDQDIEFIRGGDPDGTVFRELSINRELTVVRSSGIECRNNGGGGGSNGGGNNNGGNNNGGNQYRPPFFPPDFEDEDNDNIPDIFDEDIDEDTDDDADTNDDGVVSQQEQADAAESDLEDGETSDGETTDGDDNDTGGSGVSASSGENGSEASTPGASASSGGDPDEQAPVGQQQAEEQGGDVVDEVATEGPLPETGGASVAAGTSLALVLFGVSLLALRLVSARRGGRT